MKYYQFIIGCQQNYADGEKIAAILDSLGYQASEPAEANLIIIIACSVRQKAVDRIWGKVNQWQKCKIPKKYILCGCVLPEDKKKIQAKIDLIIDSKDINQLPKLLGSISLPTKQSKKISRFPSSEIGYVSIGVGCNNFCSYCAVPYARGRETYFPIEDIVGEAQDLISKGCCEIMLLAQNVNSYEYKDGDKIYTFEDVLEKVNQLNGDFKISFLSPHPKDTSESLIKAVGKLDKVKKEVHLPLQSGDDEILKKMNRHYTAKQYTDLVAKIRKSIPKVYISTDIIVGFPTETEAQFNNTFKLCRRLKFNKAFVSQYSSRSGTFASKNYIDDVSPADKKKRWLQIDKLINH